MKSGQIRRRPFRAGPVKGLVGGKGGWELFDSGYISTTTGSSGWETDSVYFSSALESVDKYLLFLKARHRMNAQTAHSTAICYHAWITSLNAFNFRFFSLGGGRTLIYGWSVLKVAGGVQSGVYAYATPAGTGLRTVDIPIAAVTDYTQCDAWITNSGEYEVSTAGGSGAYILDARLTSNTNLRVTLLDVDAGAASFYLAWQVWDPKG